MASLIRSWLSGRISSAASSRPVPATRASTASSRDDQSPLREPVILNGRSASIKIDSCSTSCRGRCIAGSNFAAEASGFDQLDSRLPAWDVRQLDEDRDLRSELPGGRDHPGSATGKIIEIAQGRLNRRNVDAWGVVARQSKQAAGAAADDHADRDASIGRDLSSELGEPTVGHDQGCEQTPVRTAQLAVAGEHCRQRGLWSPYQGLVVKQAVEQLHDQQATQSILELLAHRAHGSADFVVARRGKAPPLPPPQHGGRAISDARSCPTTDRSPK